MTKKITINGEERLVSVSPEWALAEEIEHFVSGDTESLSMSWDEWKMIVNALRERYTGRTNDGSIW